MGEQKVAEWRKWFDSRLDDAIEAAATQENQQVEGNWSLRENRVERVLHQALNILKLLVSFTFTIDRWNV